MILNTCTCSSTHSYGVSDDGQWTEWSEWSIITFSTYEKSKAYTYLDTALCRKTNKTRQRTCNIDKLSGQGELCSGMSLV